MPLADPCDIPVGTRFLVLGGTGVIGSRLVERLSLQWQAEVTVMARRLAGAVRVARYPVRLIAGDVCDRDRLAPAMQGADVVVDCTYARSGTLKERCAEARHAATNIAETALSAGVRRVVHLSTISVYGRTPDGVLRESAVRDPQSDPYGRSKLIAEQTMVEHHRQHDLPVVVLQPTVVYGPYAGWSIGPLNQLRAGTFVLVNNGAGLCNAVYLDDVVDAILLAATTQGIDGEVFLVSAAQPVSWHAFYQGYERMIGRPATLGMPAAAVRQALHDRARRNTPAKRLYAELRKNPELRQMLLGLPVIAQSYRLLRMTLAGGTFQRLKTRMLGNQTPAKSSSAGPGPARLIYPSSAQLELYESRTEVSIEKAGRLLGYRPRYDLAAGMAMTAQWAEWARLIG